MSVRLLCVDTVGHQDTGHRCDNLGTPGLWGGDKRYGPQIHNMGM